MPFNGAGVYSPPAADFPAVANTLIESAHFNNVINDIATGLSNCITKDGQQTITSNIPMNGFVFTGLGSGISSRTRSANIGDVQDGLANWVASGGTGDAVTATYSPAITALVDGQFCFFRATAVNTIVAPTFAPNGLTARSITRTGGVPLNVGDIPGNLAEVILRYNLANTRWELLNPANPFKNQGLTDGATINWDVSQGAAATVTLGGSRIVAAPTNMRIGQRYSLTITQDGTGSRTLTWNAVFKGQYGAAMPQPNPVIGAVTLFTFLSDGTNLYLDGFTGQAVNPSNMAQTLTDAATTTWDTNSGAVAFWAMGASRTLAAPTNMKTGGRYVLVITQDATGGRAITWNSAFKGDGGNAMPQPSQQANAVTTFTFTSPVGADLRLESHEAMVLLDTKTASSSSSLDFTNLTGFQNFVFVLDNLIPATNAVSFQAQISQDNGSSFKAGGADYHYAAWTVNDGAASGPATSAATSAVTTTGAVSNNTSHGVSGTVQVHNLAATATQKAVDYKVWYLNSGGLFESNAGTGQYTSDSNAINALRFKMSSGNIASGVIKLYGLRG